MLCEYSCCVNFFLKIRVLEKKRGMKKGKIVRFIKKSQKLRRKEIVIVSYQSCIFKTRRKNPFYDDRPHKGWILKCNATFNKTFL